MGWPPLSKSYKNLAAHYFSFPPVEWFLTKFDRITVSNCNLSEAFSPVFSRKKGLFNRNWPKLVHFKAFFEVLNLNFPPNVSSKNLSFFPYGVFMVLSNALKTEFFVTGDGRFIVNSDV